MTVCRKITPQLPDEIRSEFWKPLFFLKDGRTIRGFGIYPSEKEAYETTRSDYEKIKRDLQESVFRGENGSFTGKFLSHFMVIPWKNK